MRKNAAHPVRLHEDRCVLASEKSVNKGQNLPHLASRTDRAQKPSGTAGFTLIELTIVVTTLGILATIAIANYASARDRAYIATIVSDLKNISYAQELYFTNNYEYAQATPQLDEYSQSPDVILLLVATREGWTAKGTHKANSDYQCAVFSGTVAVNFAPSIYDGAIECSPKSVGGRGGGGGGGGGGGAGRGGGGRGGGAP